MIDADAALAYVTFVEARHEAWMARQRGESPPWTAEPIVASHKFTNVFRVLDYGSQFVLTDLVDPGLDVRNQLMRLFLYRHTGRVEVWQYAEMMLGRYPVLQDLDELLRIWTEYRGKTSIITAGTKTVGKGSRKGILFERRLFTSAYLVFPQSQVKGTDKLTSIIELTRRLFDPSSPDDVVPDFESAGSQYDRFHTLRRNKGVADFMSMQVLTDWGYTPHCGEDRENEFVILGPGARKGALALDPTGKPDDTFRWALEAVHRSDTYPVLLGRAPSYMDVQNTLCEFSKHVRYAQKPLPAKPYQPAHPGPQPPPVLPEHW